MRALTLERIQPEHQRVPPVDHASGAVERAQHVGQVDGEVAAEVTEYPKRCAGRQDLPPDQLLELAALASAAGRLERAQDALVHDCARR
jgi:hypothetical protein